MLPVYYGYFHSYTMFSVDMTRCYTHSLVARQAPGGGERGQTQVDAVVLVVDAATERCRGTSAVARVRQRFQRHHHLQHTDSSGQHISLVP